MTKENDGSDALLNRLIQFVVGFCLVERQTDDVSEKAKWRQIKSLTAANKEKRLKRCLIPPAINPGQIYVELKEASDCLGSAGY